jgi:sialidase-1
MTGRNSALLARWAAVAALVFGALVARSAEETQWTTTYDMTKLPGCGGWFGKTTTSTVEDGVLRVVDASSEVGEGHCFTVEWGADPKQEAVAEARLKVVSSEGDAGVALWVSNGVNEEGIQFRTDGFDLAFAGLKHQMDTTADFHVYRVTIQGSDIKVYVDGELAVDGTGKFTAPAHAGRNALSFGSASSTAKGESLWDYVRFSTPLVIEMQTGLKPPEMEHVTIFRDDKTYAVFPSIRQDKATDTLSTSFRAGGPRSHIDAQGARTVTMVSTDGGRTWQEGPGIPGEPFKGPNGRLISVACKWWQEHPASEREALEAQGYYVANVREGVVAVCAGAYWSWSDDGGQTWEKKDIEVPFTATLASGMNSIQLDDGTILFPVYGQETANGPDSSWVLRSTDYGETWEFIKVGTHPDGRTHLNEPEIIECKSGRLLMVMRTGVGNDHLWQAVSDDKGATWHDLKDTGVKGHPPDLLRLQDGRILLTYGHRHEPFGIRAVVSSDEGETWDLDHIWVLREDGGGTDLGYPHSVQLKDGTVVTIYYFVEPGGMQYIACTRWRVP